MFELPIGKKRRVGEHQVAVHVGKNLRGFAGSHHLLRSIEYRITERHFGGRIINEYRLDCCPITMAEWQLVFAGAFDHRGEVTVLPDIAVADTHRLAKCFAAIFEVGDVMAVPDNSQGVRLIETYAETGAVSEDMVHQLVLFRLSYKIAANSVAAKKASR